MAKASIRAILVLTVVVVAAVVLFFWQRQGDTPPEQVAPPQAERPAESPASAEPSQPQIQHPIEQIASGSTQEETSEEESAPLDADALIRKAVTGLLSQPSSREMLFLDGFVRRVVVTVDNLPREKLPRRLSPVKPAEGGLLVEGDAHDVRIAADNAARYVPYVMLAEAVDAGKLVSAYRRLYPLFQQAYVDLGYPNGYFNDRLVEVIDHLLMAPEIDGPVHLIQPKVLYQFADTSLENLSAGQKIMVRMGTDNAKRIKAKLRVIRDRLAGEAKPG